MKIAKLQQTSWNGITRTVYSTKVGNSTITSGNIVRLIKMAKQHQEPTQGHFTKS